MTVRRQMVCVGVVAGAHGVRGLVRVKSFTERPEDIVAYGPLSDEGGARTLILTLAGRSKGQLLARIEGVADRDAAEALKGVRLHVPRAALPEPEADSFYHGDLIGLAAEYPDGRPLGRVRAVHDFGAGTVLELTLAAGGAAMLPFTRDVVPLVDLAGGRLVADPPAGLMPEGDDDDDDDGSARGRSKG